MTKSQLTFLCLAVAQTLHSIEEYLNGLYDSFPPARFVSGLVSADRQRGFLLLNVLIVLFVFWCFVWPVRRRWPSAPAFMWLWVCVELANGVVHPAWSIIQRSYTPGVATAPLLFGLALYLADQLYRAPT